MRKFNIIKYYNNLPIRFKLLVGYATVLVLFLSISYLVFYPIVRTSIEANIESNLTNTTRMILDLVKTTANTSVKNYLRAVAEKNMEIVSRVYQMYQEGALSELQAKELAKSLLLSQRIGRTGYLYCNDTKGELIVHPVSKMVGVAKPEDFPFILEQLKRKKGYMEYEWHDFKDPKKSKTRLKALYMVYFEPWDWIISATAYKEEFNELINIDDFSHTIKAMSFGQTGYSFVMNSQGDIIIHPHLPTGTQYAHVVGAQSDFFIKEICRMKNGRITYVWKNLNEKRQREKLAFFNYIPELDWIVVSTCYVEEVYAPLIQMRNVFIAMVVVTLAMLFLLTIFYSSYIVNSLDKLIAGFKAGGAGDLTVRLDHLADDEFGKLIEGFNNFMKKLEEYRSSLQKEIELRKEADLASRESGECFSKAFHSSPVSIALTDVGTAKFIDMNERWVSLIGYTRDEMVGHRAKELGIWCDLKVRDNFLAELHKNGSVKDAPVQMKNKFGKILDLLLSAELITVGGRDVILFSAADVTERKRAEEELKKAYDEMEKRVEERTTQLSDLNKNLEKEISERKTAEGNVRNAYNELKIIQDQLIHSEKMATVGLLAAGVAHEINNPAGFVISNIDILKDYTNGLCEIFRKYEEMRMYYNDNQAGKTPEFFKKIEELKERYDYNMIISDLPRLIGESVDGMRRIKRIVTDLRSFSRSDEGNLLESDVHELIQSAINIVWNEIKYKADLIKEYGEVPKIYCNPHQISQVFLNLLVNAAQAITDKGKIIVKTSSDEKYVIIAVSDNGCGMTEKVIRHIFEPFFTTKPVGKGTGLGLSLAYNIIKSHRGEISVESHPGEGTTFTVRLPKGA
ncbi:MAG TPA: cache domain-containing protein [Candidatus Omnitrophota bacterium]|nr:cache domain-containing protein [Candidatus Omnitrophota bacterium]